MNQKTIITAIIILAITAVVIAYFAFSVNRTARNDIKEATEVSSKPSLPIAGIKTDILKDTANVRIRFDTTDGNRQWVAWVDGHAVNAYVIQDSNGKRFVAAKFLETLYFDSTWKQITPKNVIR